VYLSILRPLSLPEADREYHAENCLPEPMIGPFGKASKSWGWWRHWADVDGISPTQHLSASASRLYCARRSARYLPLSMISGTKWKPAGTLGKLEWSGPRYVYYLFRAENPSRKGASWSDPPTPGNVDKGSYGRQSLTPWVWQLLHSNRFPCSSTLTFPIST
jgi:hypothetical protein